MSVPGKKNMEQWMQERVKDHEFEFNPNAWKDMAQKLQTRKKESSRKVNRRIYGALFLAACVCLFLTWFYQRPGGNNSDNSISKIENQNSGTPQTQPDNISHPHHNTNAQKLSGQATGSIDANTLGDDLRNYAQSQNQSGSYKNFDHFSGNDNNLLPHPLLNDNNSITNDPENGKNLEYIDYNSNVFRYMNDTFVNIPAKTGARPKTNLKNTSNNLSYIRKPEFPSPEKRTISFGPLMSVFFIQTSLPNGNQKIGLCNVGGFISYPLTSKLSIYSGLTYSSYDKNLLKSDTTPIINDVRGPINRVTEDNVIAMGYLNLPVMVKYQLSKNLNLMGGAQVSYALSMESTHWTADFKKTKDPDSFFHDQMPLSYDDDYNAYTDHPVNKKILNALSLEIPVGIQWNMSKRWDLSGIYQLGITNVLKPGAGYVVTEGNKNSMFQLRIAYHLCAKKFPGDWER